MEGNVHLNATQECGVQGRIINRRGDKFLVDLAREATCRKDLHHAWAFATDLLLR